MKTGFVLAILSIFLLAGVACASQNAYGVGPGNGHADGNNNPNVNDTDNRNWTHVKNITFIPWQKINESECMEGCECHGAVVSCFTEYGKIINITAGRSGNVITIIVNKTEANTTLQIFINNSDDDQNRTMERNRTRLHARLSNGTNAEIKIMPDVAAERALERLRLKVCNQTNNCTIELKDVGKKNQTVPHYQIQMDRHYRILFLFKAKSRIGADVNAENGQVISEHHPWWAFLAKEE